MRDERRKGLGPYIRCLADLMGLRDWTTCVSEETTDNTAHVAEAECLVGQKWINVYVSQSFFLKDDEARRQTLVHELLHAHLAPADQVLRVVLDDRDYRVWKIGLEYAVDGMATEWAVRLPLPSEVSAVKKKKPKPVEVVTAPTPHPPQKKVPGTTKKSPPTQAVKRMLKKTQ